MTSADMAITDSWTTRRLMSWTADYLHSKRVDTSRVVAEMLLAHVFTCERMRLYMEIERPASPAELKQLRELVARAANHEPVQYLTGEGWFFGRAFAVNSSTMIPRPCTETLVDYVIHWLRERPEIQSPVIADIGTGTGCIAISLAAQIPTAKIIATDISPDAIELAQSNAERHKVGDRIEFRVGDGTDALQHGEKFSVLCSNPPYIPDDEWDAVAPNVKNYEPKSALRGGPDGLDYIRPIINHAKKYLIPSGLLAVEIPHSKRNEVMELAKNYSDAKVIKDDEGLWRVLVATNNS